MGKKLKIACVTAADPGDRRTWSGSTFYMCNALEKHVGRVDFLGPVFIPGQPLKERMADIYKKIFKKRTYPTRTHKASKYYSKTLGERIDSAAYDFVFAPAASVEIAFLETDLPVVYVSDATFSLRLEVYPIFSAMSRKGIEDEQFFEKAALRRSRLVLYPSEWAQQSAVHDYGVDPSKVRAIPFGANIERAPDRESVIGKRVNGRVKMLFLAKEWERKGGPTAFEALKALVDMGVDAELIVCGVIPPSGFTHPGMTVIPYLDKNVPEDRKRFEQTLREAHLLLLPTKTECYGIVFCEANAYGLPVFGTRTGGIPSIVTDGENGYLLPEGAEGKDFAREIADSVMEEKLYSSLNIKARNAYETRLNWDSWGIKVREAVQEVIGV